MIATRRTFLAGAGAGAGALVVTPDLSWAAGALDRAAPWSLATADFNQEIAARPMRLVRGRAPRELAGSLYRNGPAKFRRSGRSASHWFDGDGLMRRFQIAGGEARLTARFADTPKRRQEERLGAMVVPGFGTAMDPRAVLRGPDDANAANTSVLPVGDKVWALWEAGSPLAMDPDTLATDSFVTLRPDLKSMPFSAHPRIEPDGRIWNFGVRGKRAIIWRLSPAGALEAAQMLDLPRASYLHDFTATAKHLVIVLQPWVRERQGPTPASSFDWRPELGTLALVIDKSDLSKQRVVELPPFGFFHMGDAWEERDGTIRFDVCTYANMDFAGSGARDVLNGAFGGGGQAGLTLAVLPPTGRGRLERIRTSAEFPRSDPRRAGLSRRFSVHTSGSVADRPMSTGWGVTDLQTGRTRHFDFGAGHIADEMVLIPKAGSDKEDQAWLLGPTINLKAGVTELHLFDMARLDDGPVATWAADVAMPASFHGRWKPA